MLLPALLWSAAAPAQLVVSPGSAYHDDDNPVFQFAREAARARSYPVMGSSLDS